MPLKKFTPAFTFTGDRLAALKAIAPEAFNAEGQIDWEALRIALGENIEDGKQESFGLNWPGKRAARRLALTPVHKTLAPAPGEGVNEDSTRNIFIEGDNLDALKLLRKAYSGRVKMIYIDPPYNTGHDFIYKDNFAESAESFGKKTGEIGEDGERLVANPKSSGRFHSNWLNMIYPRLLLARELLREDGVIFVSIDDNEVHNLRQVMDEIYGVENFVGVLVWQAKKGGGSDNAGLVADHEYVITFAKSYRKSTLARTELTAEPLDKLDANGSYRLGRELNKWGSNSRREDRPTMWFPIKGPAGGEVWPIRNDGAEGCWRWGKPKMLAAVNRGDVEFVARDNGTFIAYEKIRSADPRTKPYRSWLTKVGTTADGSKHLTSLFDGKKVFDFAKPLDLVAHLLSLGAPNGDEIVIDFFAGSGTTAEAVVRANLSDDGERQFACIQLPEIVAQDSESGKLGFNEITEIATQRIKCAMEVLAEKSDDKLAVDDYAEIDFGFKVFKIQDSHFTHWSDYDAEDIEGYQRTIDDAVRPLKAGWAADAVLTEIALQEGFPLDSAIASDPAFTRNTLRRVSHESCAHALVICLDERLFAETVNTLALGEQDVLICFDSALSDEAKLRLADRCKLKVI
jgi:adenine-specific DNA-methyltransferase